MTGNPNHSGVSTPAAAGALETVFQPAADCNAMVPSSHTCIWLCAICARCHPAYPSVNCRRLEATKTRLINACLQLLIFIVASLVSNALQLTSAVLQLQSCRFFWMGWIINKWFIPLRYVPSVSHQQAGRADGICPTSYYDRCPLLPGHATEVLAI